MFITRKGVPKMMQALQRFLFVLLITSLPVTSHAQSHAGGRPGAGGAGQGGGAVSGLVLDAQTGHPIEYATVVLHSLRSGEQVTGGVTDAEGAFLIRPVRPGGYQAEISFLGYETLIIDSIRVAPQSPRLDLGTIELHPGAIELEGVDYVLERSPIEYQIDKKVVHVSKQPTAASGTAVDVLENVPSVQVDIEGNVQLRGSGNFTVLIDGRPTVLDANDALQMTPASTIENIEIITNPSAKHDPDGTAGIINIILKKDRQHETSGMASLSYGSFDRIGGDVLLTRQIGRVRATLGAEYNDRGFEADRYSLTRTVQEGYTHHLISRGIMDRGRYGGSARASLEFELTESDWLTLGGSGGVGDGGREMVTDYEEWTDTTATHLYYTSYGDRSRKSTRASAYLDYRHQFERKGHELTSRVQTNWYEGDEETTSELIDDLGVQQEGTRNLEKGPASRSEFELDYTLPHGEEQSFETGYQWRYGQSGEETEYYAYDPAAGGYQFYPEFSHETEYRRTIHSLYAMYGGVWGALGYQAGLRGELTDREMELLETGERFAVQREDLYPSAHLSYDLPRNIQLMASYSRRIDRPRSWYLEPFETWIDAYNVRRGNPALEPELIDSYEAGYQLPIGPLHHSAEVYYRRTNDLVERIRTPYEPGVMLHTLENVGTGHALGVETMFTGDLLSWWNVNLMGNFFQDRVEGEIDGEAFDNEDFSWSTRLAMTYKITGSLKLQTTGMYNSPHVTSQGESDEFFMVNAALEKGFWDNSLKIILQVRDLFDTMEHARTTTGRDIYSYSQFDMESPIYSLTLRYNFNQYREKRGNGRGGADMGEGDDFIE